MIDNQTQIKQKSNETTLGMVLNCFDPNAYIEGSKMEIQILKQNLKYNRCAVAGSMGRRGKVTM